MFTQHSARNTRTIYPNECSLLEIPSAIFSKRDTHGTTSKEMYNFTWRGSFARFVFNLKWIISISLPSKHHRQVPCGNLIIFRNNGACVRFGRNLNVCQAIWMPSRCQVHYGALRGRLRCAFPFSPWKRVECSKNRNRIARVEDCTIPNIVLHMTPWSIATPKADAE